MDQLVFINKLGKDSTGNYAYEFYFSDDIECFWMTDADIKPASICQLGLPDAQMFDYTETLHTDIILDLAQRNSCFSMQDCIGHIIALAFEKIDDYDEFPDPRIVLPFGIDKSEVEKMLAKRDLYFDDKQ